jgi:hypothetical protein
MRLDLQLAIRRTLIALSAGAALTLSGCGVGTLDTAGTVNTAGSGSNAPLTFTGKLIGGENPIIGGQVSFYETSATGVANILARGGYYAPASPLSPLGTVYSQAGGQFTFTTPLACTHNTDYVYATAYGGNSGANAFNPNILLVAAVGTCASLSTSTYVIINELSTVAAAYALGGFSSLGGSNGTTLSITASTTNYATASASTPSAAGLAHAFANAANLVNVFTGITNSSLPSNPNAVVPLSVINALGNSIQACVNSGGGTAGDGSACGNLFTDTTSNYTSNSVNTIVTPTNTFGALLNIARYPSVNVAAIYALGSAQAAFAPAINAAPQSWYLAIAYPQYDGATNGITNSSSTNGLYYPVYLTLDANDNVYVLNSNTSSAATSPAQSQSNIVAFTSNGTPLYATAVDTTRNVKPRQIAADAVGNVFLLSDSGVTEFNAASGTATQNITIGGLSTGLTSIAVDGLNDLWVGVAETVTAGTQNLYEYTCGSPCGNSATYSNVTFPITPTAGSVAGYTPNQLFIDSSRNVWASNYNASAVGQPFQLDYKTATSSYSAAEGTGTLPTGTGYNGEQAMVVASNGKGWTEGSTEICKMNGAGPSCPYYNVAIAKTVLGLAALDGNNNMWTVDTYNGFLGSYPTTTSASGNVTYVYGAACVSTAAAACTTSSLSSPLIPQVDSTGSVWVNSPGNGGVLQFIGAATPTWPLLSLLKPGVMP